MSQRWPRRRGASVLSYGLILAVVALVALVSIGQIGAGVGALLEDLGRGLSGGDDSLADELADVACPDGEVVTGVSGGQVVCAPLAGLLPAAGAVTAVTGAGAVTVSTDAPASPSTPSVSLSDTACPAGQDLIGISNGAYVCGTASGALTGLTGSGGISVSTTAPASLSEPQVSLADSTCAADEIVVGVSGGAYTCQSRADAAVLVYRVTSAGSSCTAICNSQFNLGANSCQRAIMSGGTPSSGSHPRGCDAVPGPGNLAAYFCVCTLPP